MSENETGNDSVVDNQTEQQDVVDAEVKDEQVADEQQSETLRLIETKDEQKETTKTKTGVLDFIKNIVRGKTDDTVDGDTIGEGADIPDEFTNVALEAGWTKEQIAEWASDYTDAELKEYAKDLIPSSEDSDKSEQTLKNETFRLKEDETQQKVEKDDKVKDDEKDAVIAKLTERLDKLEKGQQKNIEQDAQEKFTSMASRATQLMDEQSKQFEIFGVFEEGKPNSLPRFPDGCVIPSSPQMKARNEVWGLALTLHEKAGMDFEQALSTSLNTFKGKNLVKDVKRNLVKDLKKSEKRLSAKRSSHEQVKTHTSGLDVIKEVKRKHGID